MTTKILNIEWGEEFQKLAREENMTLRTIKKQLKLSNRYFKNCGLCEFSGKPHLHIFIPRNEPEIREQFDKGAENQDYFETMSFNNFKLFLEENGILDAINEIIESVSPKKEVKT